MSDYDTIARKIDEALTAFTGNAHEPGKATEGSDSITMTKDGFIAGVIRFQRLRDWVEGLAETHRRGCAEKDLPVFIEERLPMPINSKGDLAK